MRTVLIHLAYASSLACEQKGREKKRKEKLGYHYAHQLRKRNMREFLYIQSEGLE